MQNTETSGAPNDSSDKYVFIQEYENYLAKLRTHYELSIGKQITYSENLYSEHVGALSRLDLLSNEIRAIRLSTSWRITAPVRSIFDVAQRHISGFETLAKHRQMFGIKATLRRLIGFMLGRKGPAPSLQVVAEAGYESRPAAPPKVPAFMTAIPDFKDSHSLAGEYKKNPSGLGSRGRRSSRILYISGESHTPGQRYRVLRYLESANEVGYQSEWMRVEDIKEDLDTYNKYDILIIWRAMWNDNLARIIYYMKALGRTVVFDVDDLMVEPDIANTKIIDGIRSQSMPEKDVKGLFTEIRRTMLAADICFAPTERLAYHMREANKVCYVLPNGFDQKAHDVSRQAARQWSTTRTDDFIRIGYAGGSRTHQKDLGVAIDAIARILREFPKCLLVLFVQPGSETRLVDIEEYPALVGLEDRIEWRYLQPLELLPFELARFDINLAPLEVGNPFCESKSELKFFEAALVGTPTIASPTGPFRSAIDHGKSGFLAVGEVDWYSYLSTLVEKSQLRARMGMEAYHGALAKFGPTQRREKFARVLDCISGSREGAQAFALEAALSKSRDARPKIYDSEFVFKQDSAQVAPISVIVPLYNYENYIIETLESIKDQTLTLLDLIIVDGFSTDNSLSIALGWVIKYANRFNRCIVLKNNANYGLGFCRNSGVAASDSPYFFPVDADNRLKPRACEALLEVLLAEQVAFVYSSLQQFGSASGLLSDQPYDPQRFLRDNYIDAMALVSKEAWAMIGGYEHIKEGWEDYDFWVRMAENGLRGFWTQEILAEYRVHPVSMMHTYTMVPANKKNLHENFKTRHPWVTLSAEQTALNLPSQHSLSDLSPSDRDRFIKLLPILCCPKTKQKLVYDTSSQRLVTADGTVAWDVHHGIPILRSGSDIKIMPEDHISNALPNDIMQLIEATPGLVLNLSAGGTLLKCSNVIEAEFAVFRNTDVVTDAHNLPFDDEAFDLVISMNAFEHYIEPRNVLAELFRVLKPGGKVLIRTAFLQPLHEAPWHFYNCTRYGLEAWFRDFDIEKVHVSDNFNPVHSLAWIASDLEVALRTDVSPSAADQFQNAAVGDFVEMWRCEKQRNKSLWTNFYQLNQQRQEATAAGFELIARKPPRPPL